MKVGYTVSQDCSNVFTNKTLPINMGPQTKSPTGQTCMSLITVSWLTRCTYTPPPLPFSLVQLAPSSVEKLFTPFMSNLNSDYSYVLLRSVLLLLVSSHSFKWESEQPPRGIAKMAAGWWDLLIRTLLHLPCLCSPPIPAFSITASLTPIALQTWSPAAPHKAMVGDR